jgi:hypothetical protein
MARFSSEWISGVIVTMVVIAGFTTNPVPDFAASSHDARAIISEPSLAAQSHAIRMEQERAALRAEYKRRLVDELIAGRLTLHEVAMAFAEINAGDGNCQEMVSLSARGNTVEERLARNVLGHLDGRTLFPQERASVLARLHRQFEERFGYPAE